MAMQWQMHMHVCSALTVYMKVNVRRKYVQYVNMHPPSPPLLSSHVPPPTPIPPSGPFKQQYSACFLFLSRYLI